MAASPAAPSPSTSIVADHLSVTRGNNEVLHQLSFAVRSGVVTGLLGPSGSGKTTLMRAVVGVQKHAGDLTIDGIPAGSASLRSRIGYVTQAASVYDDLSVAENLHFFARILGVDGSRVNDCLELVGLSTHSGRVVGSLSGGERSRVSLAVALLGEPDVLVLDEPTVGLDPVLRQELWTTFAQLAAEGRTLLVSSHVMDEATRCDELLLLRDGDLIAQDSPAALLAATGATDIEQAFLALVKGAAA